MSFDVVELIKDMDFRDTRLQLGLQCAPVIAGRKASNLFTIQKMKVSELETLLFHTDLSHELLYEGEERAVFLVYQAHSLSKFLAKKDVKRALEDFGYTSSDLTSLFPIFKKKYEGYMRKRESFPHELGLLLEYPLEDVLGFIEQKGKNFLYSGYWKVYKDKEKKMQLFEEFERLQREIVSLILEELKFEEIVLFYKELGQGSVPNYKVVQVA